MATPQPRKKISLYNIDWDPLVHPLSREMFMIQHGGQFKQKNGGTAGNGMLFHFRRFQEIVWPEIVWHKWNLLSLESYLKYRIIGEIGPASSGKTHDAAINVLTDYYCFSDRTTVLVSSTTRESLEMRVWGEIKNHHKVAKSRIEWLPGNLIEGRQRIVTDDRDQVSEGRDFRNGLVGVACKKGQNFQGLGEYTGIKNKRVRLVADEGHFMPRAYVDAIANLNKNKDFKCIVLGNPKETTDALGVVCEPSAAMGGWDGGIDQTPGTKTWETRFDQGICIQYPGSDSPNLDGKLGCPIITQQDIDADIKFYGKESLQYTMMDEGRMPRGQGSRRVITRQLCLKFNAMEEPVWLDNKQTQIGFLDAAYRGTGGDRCIFGHLKMGKDVRNVNILALETTMLVPIDSGKDELPEDQIAKFTKQECEARGISPENFFFDSTGRGTLVSAYARLWSPNVGCVEFGGSASERPVASEIDLMCKDYYSKFVSELWFSVRLAIESGQFRGMTEDVMSEGCMREWGMTAGNKIEVEPKDKMKIKTGRSPDLFDALVAGVEGARRRGFVIEKLSNQNPDKRGRDWKKVFEERAKKLWRGKELNYAA